MGLRDEFFFLFFYAKSCLSNGRAGCGEKDREGEIVEIDIEVAMHGIRVGARAHGRDFGGKRMILDLRR